MRYVRFTIYCLLVLLSSCEKEIDIDYRTIEPRYVAEVEVKPGMAKARLTTTRAIENSRVEDTYVTNATVTVSMVPDGKSYQLKYTGRGFYEAKVAGIEGQEYLADIEIDGQHYTSTSTMLSAPVINSFTLVWQDIVGERMLFGDLRLQDNPTEHNYYFMHLYRNGIGYRWAVMRDTSNPGDELQQLFSCTTETEIRKNDSDELRDGDRLRLEVRSIDKLAYDYLYSLQTMDNSGSNPIQNFTGGMLGYFSAYQSQTCETVFYIDSVQTR